MDAISHPSYDLIFQFFSFLGWCGVSVFVFLSGYGLVKKHETEKKQVFNNSYFVFRNFKKIFFLMLPGVVFFMLLCFWYGNLWGGLRTLLYLTLLNNLFVELNPFNPGVYWYFGLTFQLYIIYLFYHKYREVLPLIISIFLFLLILLAIPLSTKGVAVMDYVKHNFIGWLPIFLVGIVTSRSKRMQKGAISTIGFIFIFVLSFITSVFLNCNYYLWILLPFCTIITYYAFIKSVYSITIIKKSLSWLGTYSASIFLVNPIARFFILWMISHYSQDIQGDVRMICIYLFLYIVLTGFLAYYNNKIYCLMRNHFVG